MKKKVFSLMMTLVLAFMGMAQAQVSLPYEEGFESGIGGWTLNNCYSSTGVQTSSSYAHTGSASFDFYFSTNPPQYLISPEFTGVGSSLDVEFYYRARGTSYTETFHVGYSTTTNAISAFEFGPEISTNSTSWSTYTNSFPAGTKYVAIKYTANDQWHLYLDDFSFTTTGGGGGGGGTAEEQLHLKYMVGTDTYMIDTLDLGVRPANAWMAPFEFTMYSEGPAYQVNLLDFTPSDGMFTVSGQELPFEVRVGEDVTLGMSTNGTAAGVIERQFVAITELIREAHVWPIKVELYDPEIPDVWEKACTDAPTNVPYSMAFTEKPATDHGTTLHNDYTLPFPEIPEGVDAVYKLVYTKDVILNASVITGADGKVALYTEDFNGEGGPMADNYYNGPSLPTRQGDRATLTSDFEDGTIGGWTVIDANSDGWTWTLTSDIPTTWTYYAGMSLDWYHGGSNAICSGSYINGVGAISPDEYLVSPQVNLGAGSSISFWVAATDESYAADHFGVFVSDNGTSNWTSVQEWTLTGAKSGLRGGPASRNGDGLRLGTWFNYTVDLSAYDGQKYVAFRHFNCYDQYIMCLDDITIVEGSTGGGGGGGGSTSGGGMAPITYGFGPTISDMPVEAGTYYLVASSTDADFEVSIDAALMPCPEITGFDFDPTPADNADDLQPDNLTVSWTVPTYATEWRIILGSTYYPELDHPYTQYYPNNNGEWGWSTELASSYTFPRALFQNTNYFWRVEFRNNGECINGVSSPVWGFTTTFRVPQNLVAEDETVFNDEQIHLSWDPVVDRTYRKYFIYRDGVKVGETTEHDINATSFTDGPLTYNMAGYVYYVTAVYDEGESPASNTVTVLVSGYGNVAGYVYEQDETTGIVGATVTMEGEDEFGDPHTYTFTTGAGGAYSGQVYAGVYNGSAACAGYQPVDSPYIGGNPIAINYNATTQPVNYKLDENFYGPCGVVAQYYPDSTDVNSEYVKVYWGCGLPGMPGETIFEPFETGDFSSFDWVMDPTYPWTIDNTVHYEGEYSMRSGAHGVDDGISTMSVTVEIPQDGLMSFFGKISSENNWDYGYFFIDGTQKASFTGIHDWVEKTFPITEGTHTFKWTYEKDFMDIAGDYEDYFWVDNITFYKAPEPAEPGANYDFEDSTMQGWTSVDADGDGYGWMVGTELMSTQPGHNGSNDFVVSQSYVNGYGPLTPDNYLVSPLLPLGGTLKFYACAQDASYAGEHFGVAVSTTGMNPADFTMLNEWTMTAKSFNGPVGKAANYSRSGRAQGDWYEYTVDLSAYSGNGYVAIRHFDCTDMFYLDVDDIHISEPGAKGFASDNRALSHYRVYRTNCYQDAPYTEENTVLLATVWVPDTVYIDVEWADLEPGVYKWGVGAVYVGNRGQEIESPISWTSPVAVNNDMLTRDAIDYGFESGLDGWTVIDVNAGEGTWLHSDDNPSGYDYTTYAHGGSGFAMCYSFVDYVGAFDTDSYLVSPQKYSIEAGSSITFWADNANDSYPESFSVCVSTADTPSASNFTSVWNGSAKGSSVAKSSVRHMNDRLDNWRSHTIDLSAYAGQEVWIAFHDVSYDAYEVWIDDITIVAGAGGGGGGGGTGGGGSSTVDNPYAAGTDPIQEERESVIAWSNCLDKDMYLENGLVDINVLLNSADPSDGVTISLTNLNEIEQGMYPMDDVVLDSSAFYAWDSFRRGDYAIHIEKEGYYDIDTTMSIWNETHMRFVMIEIIYPISDLYVSSTGWAMWGNMGPAPAPGPEPGPDPTTPIQEWLYYDNEDFQYNIGQGSAAPFYWGIKFEPADLSAYAGCSLLKVAIFDGSDGGPYTVSVYQGGADAPGTLVATKNVTLTGITDYVDVTLDTPVAIDVTQPLWVCASCSTLDYPASTSNYCGTNPNARLCSDDGITWEELVISGYESLQFGWKLRAYVSNTGAKGVFHEIKPEVVSNESVKSEGTHTFALRDMGLHHVPFTLAGAKSEDRHLEYYKVMCESLDHEPIFNANVPVGHEYCQVATDELQEGEHYICKVAAVYSTGMSEWTECEWQYLGCENYTNIVESVTFDGSLINWGDEPTPGPGPGGDASTFTVDFDGGMPAGWTTIDFDGDGYDWVLGSACNGIYLDGGNLSGAGHNSSADLITSGSYSNVVGVLTPDNYLVSPQVTLAAGSTFSFWACGQDANYVAEHFGVFISDNGTSDWTMVQEWTMTATKGGGVMSYGRGGNTRAQGNWHQYTVDLSAYAGQKYIAIRHFNCTDMFMLDVDDIELTAGAKNRDGEVLGIMIFVDGEMEAFLEPTATSYPYTGEAETITVRTVYNGTQNLPEGNIYFSMSCPVDVDMNPAPETCEPGDPIHVEELGATDQVKIWWGTAPAEPISEWIYYDDGEYATSVGTNQETATIYWASMFPAEAIAPYAGTNLTKVAVFVFQSNSNPLTVSIYLGGANAPGTAYSTKTIVPSVDGDFEEVILDTPVAIDGTQNLWIVCSQMGAHPANACVDTGEANNRWISLNGTQWQDLANAGLPGYGWLLRGFLTNQAKGMVENVAIELPAPVATTGTLSHTEVVNIPAPMAFLNRDDLEIVKYNVYRSEAADGEYTMIGEVTEPTAPNYYEYIDTPETPGTYYYKVTAVYENDCESDGAPSFADPTVNYVTAEVTGMGENSDKVALYPNPTKGNVTIEAAGMSRITVVSVLGQVVYDTEVNADSYILNMAQFKAGMYMVRVATETGVTVKRVTVM